MAARSPSGFAPSRERRRFGGRHDRQLAYLQADGRCRSCDRRDQRFANHAARFKVASMVGRDAAVIQHTARNLAGCSGQCRQFWNDGTRFARRVHSHSRRCRRSAGGALWTGVLCAGRCEVHIRHRVFCARQHGSGGARFAKPSACDDGISRQGANGLRYRGQHLHRRCCSAVAAGLARLHSPCKRGRGTRADGEKCGRTLLRSGLYRPGSAVLGSERARRHSRADARHGRCGDRARCTRLGLLSNP